MSVGQWLIWLVPETVKILLITYGIFGFEFKKMEMVADCSMGSELPICVIL